MKSIGHWIGGCLLVAMCAGCGSYRQLDVSVLRPGTLELGPGPVRVLFVDRKVVRETDLLSAMTLEEVLGMDRMDAVSFFRDGVEDGLKNGAREITMTTGVGGAVHRVKDRELVPPLTADEVRVLGKGGVYTHVLSVEDCRFGLDLGGRLNLSDNLLLRLYRVSDGKVMDEVRSDTLGPDDVQGADDWERIYNFFYEKGWAYAGRMTPWWQPTTRRLYVNNRMLRLGAYYYDEGKEGDARQVWTTLLEGRSGLAARAAINLAWMEEARENYDGALALVRATLATLPEGKQQALRAYLKDLEWELERRLEENDEISEQLNN